MIEKEQKIKELKLLLSEVQIDEMNFEEFSGISKSLFNFTARTPKIKNSNAGLVKFSKSKSKFIIH